MKANGFSASRLFSARLKWTRPTRFQAGFNAFRNDCKSVRAAAKPWANASWMSSHKPRSTSDVRYSAPGIMGAVNTSVASSASVGGGTSGSLACSVPAAKMHNAPIYRAAKSRHQRKTGGSA